jgi:hypothetical protein
MDFQAFPFDKQQLVVEMQLQLGGIPNSAGITITPSSIGTHLHDRMLCVECTNSLHVKPARPQSNLQV